MNYRNMEGLNQSLLKKILIHPQEYIREKERMALPEDPSRIAPWFVFGTLVDHMMTEDSNVEDRFYIQKTKVPSESIANIVDGIFTQATVSNASLENAPDEIILQHCNYEGYQSRWKDETRIAKVKEQGADYFVSLMESKGKIVISQDDYFKAVTCKQMLENDPFISKWLKPADDCEIIKKVVLGWIKDDVEYKAELDLVHIDHEKRIITPLDIKTMSGNIHTFPYANFWKYRYDFQGSFYESAIIYSDFRDKNNCSDYFVAPMLFLVAETDSKNAPMIFSNAASREIGAIGGEHNGRQLEGFTQAIERYKFHTKIDNWDYPQEYIEAEGEMIIA